MTAVPRWVLTHRHAVLAGLLAILLLGLNARFQLPVQLFPDIEPPLVTVITPYPGMAAEDVADNVSQPLEEEFAGIDGVGHLRSTSQEGLSVVEVEFDYDESSADGAVDVQNAINRIRNRLPANLGEPRVQEFSSAERPIVTFALSSDRLDPADVRERAENHVRDRLNLVDGVAMVDIIGAHRSQLTVHLRRDGLLAHAVTQEQVVDTLRQWNLLEPGGRIRRGDQERVVRFDRPLIDAEDAAALVLRREDDALLRLGDVADVRVGPAEPRSGYRHAGESAIAVQVLKRSEANTVAVADRLFAALDELRAENPAIDFAVAEDDSAFTRQVIGSMTATVVGAIALTVLVVLLFLGEVRQATIVAATIPVVFLATFALMQLAGLQLDMVTMSAIILAIGLLVDDSIVILENIHRHAEAGDAPDRAAIHGTGEVLLPKLGGTITTLAVLAPLVLLGGFIGELFRPLSLTLIFALSASFVIAATLVPLLAALWLRRGEEASAPWWPLARFHDLMERLRALYLTLLAVVLRRPGRTLALILVLLVGSAAMLRAGGGEMLPRFDTGSFRILLDAVPGTPVEQTGELVAEVERALLARDDVTGVSSRLGYEDGARYLGSRGAMDTHQAEVQVELEPRNRRDDDLWTVMEAIRTTTDGLPGLTLAVFQEQGGTAKATTAAPLILRLEGPDPAELDRLATELRDRAARIAGLRDAHTSWALDRPEVRVRLDRERLAEIGLGGRAVARTVQRALDGEIVAPFHQSGERNRDIVVRYAAADRAHWRDLADTVLTGPTGANVRLGDVAELETTLGPRLITREALQRTIEVRALLTGDRPLSHVVGDLRPLLADMELPDGYSAAIAGEQADLAEARGRLLRALAASALAVFLLLMIQFRSLRHPWVVMAAVPLQFIGVAIALLVAGRYLSMPAMLGIILLVGIVVNNSIILVDFILERVRDGMEPAAAVTEAVSARFRPVMMTALSTVAGMLPLALELAVGSERFAPIATVIVGGILASTLLTLLIIPLLAHRLLIRDGA